MTADRILITLVELYARSQSYRDSGVVNTRVFGLDGTLLKTSEHPFCTAFVRPDRFRFESRARQADRWSRCVVHADGGSVAMWRDVLSRVERPESLDVAIAAATGVSRGAAHTVPALLMPTQITGAKLSDLVGLELLDHAVIEGTECYRVSARYPERPRDSETAVGDVPVPDSARRVAPPEYSPSTFWIERDSFLLRRIDSVTQFETFRSETRTDYTPEIGRGAEEQELAFGV